jgi:hypothetical protein
MKLLLMTGVLLTACTQTVPGAKDEKVPMPKEASGSPAADACGARQLQRLVGRNRSEAGPAAPGQNRRIACSTCPVTMDYNPERLNIFYNERTGIIEKVSCG